MQSGISKSKVEIVIVGAGPAGTSAATRLAANDFQVTLIEREKFPRQKLCGEFISPECFQHFRDLGVFDEMLYKAGGDRITETVFYAPNGKSVNVPSEWFNQPESAALGLSRAEMDFRLLQRAGAVGVRVLEETQITGLLFENDKVRGVKAKDKDGKTFEITGDLIVDATGRSRLLGKLAEKKYKNKDHKSKNKDQRSKLVGFKVHLNNTAIEPGRCEIYFFRGGYGGLNLVENGADNHCFLIRADVVKEFNSDAGQIVEKVIFQNKRAFETMKNAVTVDDWLAVAVDGFGSKDLNPAPGLLAIGDAGAFIDPFTGSGMLMALESGDFLADAVMKSESFDKIAENYKTRHRLRFRKRLRICSFMRRAAFAPHLAGMVISALSLSKKSREFLARATRPDVYVSKSD